MRPASLQSLKYTLLTFVVSNQVIELPMMGRMNVLGEPGVFDSTDGLKLRTLLWDVVFELLVLLLERARLFRSRPTDASNPPIDLPRESIDDAKFVIRVALDHCRFDLPSTFSPAVGKQLDLVAELSRALRREIERL
jgi:hypothetical protein